MANNNLNNKNNILIKTDQNNLIFIDPNSVVENNGEVKMRSVDHEDMVMYVNLEADLIPRTTMILGDNDATKMVSISKGVFNMLHNSDGKDLDTSWSEVYTPTSVNKKDFQGNIYSTNFSPTNDGSGQSFGIDSIDINITGTNFIPHIDIKFIDVRGKTLFDSPENSPYKAFFHLPWPVFYLTIKGYYGKAIRYRLHMIKFSTRFNISTGNFEISTSFVGSTYAYLNDIPLKGILNSPYMYAIENDGKGKFNESTGTYIKTVKKSSRGYQMLTSVYDEYKSKGLIEKDFPVKTLRELIVAAGRMDKILEQQIFSRVIDPKILAAINEYEKNIQDFEDRVNAWKNINVTSEIETINNKVLNKLSRINNNKLDKVDGDNNSLQFIIKDECNKLYNNSAFGNIILKDNAKFDKGKKITENLTTIPLNKILNIELYTYFNGSYYINVLELLDLIYDAERIFVEKRKKIENAVEEEMNNIVSGKNGDNKLSFGFVPSIRNITAVILANADTYIRLLKEVHQKSFDSSIDRAKLLKSFSSDSIGDNIYPWPEVKKQSSSGKVEVLTYPGSMDVMNTLKSFNSKIWPEVEFVENYLQVSTYKSDPLTEKEVSPDLIEYIFDTDSTENNIQNINLFTSISNRIPYINKSYSSLLYEIYERARYSMSVAPYNDDTIKELAVIESKNIINKLENDLDLMSLLKSNITLNLPTGVTSNHQFTFNLLSRMASISPFEKYPYLQNQIPTIDYINEINNEDFSIDINKQKSSNDVVVKNTTDGKNAYSSNRNETKYDELNNFLKTYKPEDYRLNIYPFNSPIYLKYIDNNKTELKSNDLQFYGNIMSTTNTSNNFIESITTPDMWVKDGFKENFLTNTLKFDDGRKINILNTPYFHKQLYNDFTSKKSIGKYAGSAYLLLNSLPFLELTDRIKVNEGDSGTLVSTLFREIGATHKIPYHLMIKWGSIYHRYKKYILENIDILDNITGSLDISTFYDNGGTGRTYNIGTEEININNKNIVGFYPYYQDIFHQIVNDYLFYPFDFSGTTTNFTKSIYEKVQNNYVSESILGIKTYTSFIDNSKYDSSKSSNKYTLLPCNGYKSAVGSLFSEGVYDNLRIIWDVKYEDNILSKTYSGYTFPSYDEYFLDLTKGDYSLDTNYRKVIDLIATFKPDVLNVFEDAFLEFSTEYINTEMYYKMFDVNHDNFQKLLSEIVSVNKTDNEKTIINDNILSIINRQNEKLKSITNDILSPSNLINVTLSNPREINEYVLGSFTKTSDIISDFGSFETSQLNNDTKKLLKLYLGEFLDINTTNENYYVSFFNENNIELTEENIKLFRQLIYVYSGYKLSKTDINFKDYVKSNINPSESIFYTDSKNKTVEVNKIEKRTNTFLNYLFNEIRAYKIENTNQTLNIKRSYNDDILKLELYNYFKSFNDKWVAGNSIGQKTLMEEFLFLDKANKDIGDLVYIDMSKLIELNDPKNNNLNLYSTLVLLLRDSGLDIRALPSYVNFYGTNYSKTPKIKPSKEVAKNIFGTFLDVDIEESSPKIILQYFGPTSKHLELSDIDRNALFKGDGFNIGEINNNSIIVAPDIFKNTDFSKSNRAVAFEVSVGDINQNMFKSIELDQTSIKNTTESFNMIERLGNTAAGSQVSQIDIGLFDIYRQASYQCTVTSMGNVMIQPTMFFYLKNVPMFRGTYWITEVTHSIKTSGIETTFKGSRIPMTSLPDPIDSLTVSYRSLFEKMSKKAIVKVNNEKNNKTSSTLKSIDYDGITYYYDTSGTSVNGELDSNGNLKNIVNKSGSNEFGISYNGMNNEVFVQKVKFNDSEWLRTIVVKMGDREYPIDDDIVMSIAGQLDGYDKVYWGDIKNSNQLFYAARFKENPEFISYILTTTKFYNPREKVTKELNTNINPSSKTFTGPVHIGPSKSVGGFGIGMSPKLMEELKLKTGDVVYFKMNEVVL